MILDAHMPAQGGAIGEDDLISHLTIMGNVYIGHNPVAVTNRGYSTIQRGTAIEGAKLADRISISDHQLTGLALIFHILRNLPQRGELKNPVTGPNTGGPVDDHMGTYPGSWADMDVRANNGERTNAHVLSERCSRIYGRLWIDQITISLSAHISSALATIPLLTRASAENTQIPRFLRR